MPTTILICGSPADGFQIVGLFADSGDAPGRKNAPRERDGLFDIVRWKYGRKRGHRYCALGWERAQRREVRILPSEATRRRGKKSQPAAVGNDRGLRSIVCGLLFTMKSATPTCRVIGNFEMAGPGR